MNIKPHKFITRTHNSKTVHFFDDDVVATTDSGLSLDRWARRLLCGKLKTARCAYFEEGDHICEDCAAYSPPVELTLPEPNRP